MCLEEEYSHGLTLWHYGLAELLLERPALGGVGRQRVVELARLLLARAGHPGAGLRAGLAAAGPGGSG